MNAKELIIEQNNISSMLGDQLNVIAALIPYLQHRKEVAMSYENKSHTDKLEYIKHINEDIKKILHLQ